MKNDGRKPTTNDAGIHVSSDEYSLTVGPTKTEHGATSRTRSILRSPFRVCTLVLDPGVLQC